jgi:hypothetical protein
VLEVPLTEDESTALRASADAVRGTMGLLDL